MTQDVTNGYYMMERMSGGKSSFTIYDRKDKVILITSNIILAKKYLEVYNGFSTAN